MESLILQTCVTTQPKQTCKTTSNSIIYAQFLKTLYVFTESGRLFPVDWRPPADESIANIVIPLDILVFLLLLFQCFFCVWIYFFGFGVFADQHIVHNRGLTRGSVSDCGVSDRWHVKRNMWHMTHDTWHMTHDTWLVILGTWHVTLDTLHFSLRFGIGLISAHAKSFSVSRMQNFKTKG